MLGRAMLTSGAKMGCAMLRSVGGCVGCVRAKMSRTFGMKGCESPMTLGFGRPSMVGFEVTRRDDGLRNFVELMESSGCANW